MPRMNETPTRRLAPRPASRAFLRDGGWNASQRPWQCQSPVCDARTFPGSNYCGDHQSLA
jgi:hypothetical protein